MRYSTPQKNGPNPVRMFLLATVLLVLAGLNTGCGSSPIEKAYSTRVMFNQTVGTINAARANGLIPDATFDTINDTYHAVAELLDEVDIAAVKAEAEGTSLGAKFDFNKVFDKAIAEYNKLMIQWGAQRQQIPPEKRQPS